jgi:hypothetical protein
LKFVPAIEERGTKGCMLVNESAVDSNSTNDAINRREEYIIEEDWTTLVWLHWGEGEGGQNEG